MNNDEGDKKIKETPSEDDVVIDSEGEEEAGLDYDKKVKKLKKELDGMRKERDEYLAGWQRSKADYINRGKELALEVEKAEKRAQEKVLREILRACDSFEMAFSNKSAWEAVDKNWRHGVEYIYSQLLDAMEQFAVRPIRPLGHAFDPALHESIGQIETSDPAQDGVVLEVVSSGYTYRDGVLRPARVKVGVYKSN